VVQLPLNIRIGGTSLFNLAKFILSQWEHEKPKTTLNVALGMVENLLLVLLKGMFQLVRRGKRCTCALAL
jgi:hypothetical protein